MDAQLLERAQQQAEICKIFGSINRILIVWALGDQEMSVGEIAEAIESSLQNTSQHLRLMKDKGILRSRREQHTIYYRVAAHELVEGCQILQHALQKMSSENRKPYTRSSPEHSRQEALTND
jgi:DNA-binding transcriptional ArsR family regulator